MRRYVFLAAIFLIVAMAAFSQKPGSQAPISEVLQKDEEQIRQLEAEMLKGEMSSDATVVEKIYADDWAGYASSRTKTGLVNAVHDYKGQAPPYIASQEDMHVYMLGDTAIAMYVKKYVVREDQSRVDRWDQTDVFVKGAGTWKLKISRASPHEKAQS
jgi:hypothetical protein